MNRFLKTAILSAAVAATTLASLPAANAGEWRHGGRHWNNNNWNHNNNWKNNYRHNNNGDALAAGIVGLAAGALIVGLASQPTYREPVYVQPRPRPYRPYPEVVYADQYASALEPWTPQWYQYCSDRYRSFNERTGTYTGYDGLNHFCVAN